ncbi:MAG: type 1 glutamine amidotransferase [Gammaproteobacteria bacterium]|nr:type 1 glutamine amidotransferase [Gammaproteobacteria bacterium]
MRVVCLQHAAHEAPGALSPWLAARGLRPQLVRVYAGEPVPPTERYDWLIVLGGPMNVDDHAGHPWLVGEKVALKRALDAGRRLFGICLGAQLLAQALGAAVTRNPEPEVGWFDVELTAAGRAHRWCTELPQRFAAFHWHGDTYSLPPGAVRLAYSQACAEQAFAWGRRVLGLQFHLEVGAEDAARWLALSPPPPGRYVQAAAEVLGQPQRFADNQRWLTALLERFCAD